MSDAVEAPPSFLERVAAANSWWFAMLLLVPSLIFSVWLVVATFTPHTWTIPAEDKLTYVRGTFSSVHGLSKKPYVFETAGGGQLLLSCYPELSDNRCLAESGMGLSQIAGNDTVVGYFKASSDPLIAFLTSAPPDIIMSAKVNAGQNLSYEWSAKRLRAYSGIEESVKISGMIVGLMCSMFLTGLGGLIAYAKYIVARNEAN